MVLLVVVQSVEGKGGLYFLVSGTHVNFCPPWTEQPAHYQRLFQGSRPRLLSLHVFNNILWSSGCKQHSQQYMQDITSPQRCVVITLDLIFVCVAALSQHSDFNWKSMNDIFFSLFFFFFFFPRPLRCESYSSGTLWLGSSFLVKVVDYIKDCGEVCQRWSTLRDTVNY